MILKIGGIDGNSWTILDNLRKIDYHYRRADEIIGVCERLLDFTSVEPVANLAVDEMKRGCDFTEIWITREGHQEPWQVLVPKNAAIYILSDDGKTVERI